MQIVRNAPTKLYFAYGSNLHLEQMRKRCPGARALRKLALKDWELVFRGPADIQPKVGGVVHGGVFEITPQCEQALDRYEGYPRLYRKEHFLVRVKRDGVSQVEPVMFYRMNATFQSLPMGHYVRVIEQGYRDFDLPLESLIDALKRCLKETPCEGCQAVRDQRRVELGRIGMDDPALIEAKVKWLRCEGCTGKKKGKE